MKNRNREKTVTTLRRALMATVPNISPDEAAHMMFDRGDALVLSLESGHYELDYHNIDHCDTLIAIEAAAGLDGHFEDETSGSSIFYFDS